MKDQLDITLIQCPLHWEDAAANLESMDALIQGHQSKTSLIILPEMFNTGFSMNPKLLAEDMNGVTVNWLKETARKRKSIVAGSVIIKENQNYYNRLIWMQPDGNFGYYDKRHLFSYASEHEYFTPGHKRLIAQINGWKVCTLICYDLRFPVWSRQQSNAEYDVLIYVANWPKRRAMAWNTLLKARAIENQCYVVGVNRSGIDGNDIEYSGDSQIISPLGDVLFQTQEMNIAHSHTLLKKEIESVRTQFPFLSDKDDFMLL